MYPQSSAIERVLDLARWAPSGDNTQPWRLEIRGEREAVLHGFDTRDHCVYDLDGRPSQISIGAFIETAAVAASAEGWRLEATRRRDVPETTPTFDLRFVDDPAVPPSPLLESIRRRSVQRRPMRKRALTSEEIAALEAAVAPGHAVRWLAGAAARRRTAALLFRSARLRLTIPEAYRVHRDIIEWHARHSVDRVPDQALGASAMTLVMMRFAMKSWERVRFFNRFLAGTWIPRLEMDVAPALGCAAHFVLVAPAPPGPDVDAWVGAGRAVQRFWLTADRLGLGLQPEVTPLVFARYARDGIAFSQTPGSADAARDVGAGLEALIGAEAAARAVFMGRVGESAPPDARSLRLELAALRR